MQQSRLLSDDTTLQPIAIFLSIIVVKPHHVPQFRKCEKPLSDTTLCYLALVLNPCSHGTYYGCAGRWIKRGRPRVFARIQARMDTDAHTHATLTSRPYLRSSRASFMADTARLRSVSG
jgi:hypothetical protein